MRVRQCVVLLFVLLFFVCYERRKIFSWVEEKPEYFSYPFSGKLIRSASQFSQFSRLCGSKKALFSVRTFGLSFNQRLCVTCD